MEAFNVQNIVQGNGVAISITGMAIVFSGLVVITVFIKVLPFLLDLPLKKQLQETTSSKTGVAPVAGTAAAESTTEEGDEKDIASLIGLVLHLEQERHFQSDNQFITMNRYSGQQSIWGMKGRMRSTPHRRDYAKV